MESKWELIQSRIMHPRMYPAIHKDDKYIGCILNEKDAKFVVQACSEYPELVKRVEELEKENKMLKGLSA